MGVLGGKGYPPAPYANLRVEVLGSQMREGGGVRGGTLLHNLELFKGQGKYWALIFKLAVLRGSWGVWGVPPCTISQFKG